MSAASANSTMVSSGKDNSNSANVASSVTSVSPSGLVPSNRSVYGVWDFFNIQVPTVSFTSVSYMLIAVTILMLALAIVHKHVAKPGWKPSSQQLSEKFRLYMAGSMVGDATRRMFNGWTRSRQDSVTISTRDEKNRRDISSSSSISLSPSELPMHDASPRVYKKASKRPNSRLKTPVPSSIDDNPSAASSNDDQTIDQSTEIDESKTTVTINVSDPRSEQSILVTHQEINYEIEGIPENHNGQKAAQEQINSRNGSCQNDSEINNPITFDVLSIPTTNDLLVQVHKKNSKPRLRVQRPQKDQTVVTTQESEGEIESPSTPTAPKISTQDENFVKPVHRRRRRKTKNSKNNTQQNSQENNNSEQRSAKPDTSSKHDHVQQNVNGLPRQRQSDEMSYTNWDKSSHDQHIHLQQPRQIVNNIWQKPLHTEPAQYQTQAHHAQQRSDQSAYYMQGNKRNDAVFQTSNSSTVIPAKVTLPEINKKAAVFQRRNSQSNITSNSSTNKFISYADVISPQHRPSSTTTKISHDIPSILLADNNITAPVPAAASVRNSANHQWYSPFGSGLSIQFNPPVPPEDIHNKWASNNSTSLFSVPMTTPNYRRYSITPTSPITTSNETSNNASTSSISMFTSPPFSTSINRDRRSSSPTRSLANFGRVYNNVHDQERGELEVKNWNINDEMTRGRSSKGKILISKDKKREGTIYTDQGQNAQQFSLFDKQISFRMYPSKS